MRHHHQAQTTAALALCLIASLCVAETAQTAPHADNKGVVTAEVACGELIDKITILEIKSKKFSGEKKKNVDTELETLNKTRHVYLPHNAEIDELIDKLRAINLKLWDIEDAIRAKEREQEFDAKFIEIARSVYFTNDERCRIKRAINELCGSRLIEEKGYTDYQTKSAHPPSSGQLTATQHRDLGIAAFKARDKEATFHHLHAALSLTPHDAGTLAALGTAYQTVNDYEKALQYHRQLFRLAPDNTIIANLLASSIKLVGHADELVPLEEFFHRNRSNKESTMRLFMAYARVMRWQEAENVLKGSIFSLDNYWRGDSDIRGKRILMPMLYSAGSSGFGDVFQFTRYAKRLKEAGAHVIVQISSNKLRPLLSLCPFIDEIVTEDEPTPSHDARYPLCATAMILCFKDEVYQPSRDVPYLQADKNLVAHWHYRLGHDHNFKVGIFWQRGRVRDYFSGTPAPCSRSMWLSSLAPLATIPDVSFYSLHKGHSEEVKQLSDGFVVHEFASEEFDAEHGSFMDSAAIMKNMDLVITIDSSIAHLAGSLGVPVWTMIPTSSCYRWFTKRTDSPWYPTMRLFRQSKPGIWHDVVEQVKAALADTVR